MAKISHSLIVTRETVE